MNMQLTTAQLATQGLKDSSRWHLLGKVEKNVSKASAALDTVALAAEGDPLITQNLSLLRQMVTGLQPETRLGIQRRLLQMVQDGGLAVATSATSCPVLPALGETLKAAFQASPVDEERPQINANANKIIDQVARSSSDSVVNLLAELPFTDPQAKLSL